MLTNNEVLDFGDRSRGEHRQLSLTVLSGRGFKFAPVYGELAADLITGKPNPHYTTESSLGAQHR